MEMDTFALTDFEKKSYEGCPTLGWDGHSDFALPSSHGFNAV